MSNRAVNDRPVRRFTRTRFRPNQGLQLAKYSIGVGDRFGLQAKAQLQACIRAAERGIEVIPVWNKSHREHNIIGSTPESVREAAESAVLDCGWSRPCHIDADHINLETVDRFIPHCDFFTIDVADQIGQPSSQVDVFLRRHKELEALASSCGKPSQAHLRLMASHYLTAIERAGEIYRHIERSKGAGRFITEVSMDETSDPQSPAELLVILAALSDQKIPVQTIAPKFSGSFHKGVNYEGDPKLFEREFRVLVEVVALAIEAYGFPSTLKLSVHSGSDKFSIYPGIHRVLEETGAGLHVKTAGTTWLEELIGLAGSDGDGLKLAKEVYEQAYARRQELCLPYATVVSIDGSNLPHPDVVNGWSSEEYVRTLRHDPSCPEYNPSVRQLLHVGYKIAAEMGDRYLSMLRECEPLISRNVTENLFGRHIVPIFIGNQDATS